jgi:hypothetical protein
MELYLHSTTLLEGEVLHEAKGQLYLTLNMVQSSSVECPRFTSL